jgi:hypothetical protein
MIGSRTAGLHHFDPAGFAAFHPFAASWSISNKIRPGSHLQFQQLIHQTSRGDKRAFAALYAQTAAKLFGVALRIVARREEAEAFVAVLTLKKEVPRSGNDYSVTASSPF